MRFVLLLLAACLFAQPNSNWNLPLTVLEVPPAFRTAHDGYRAVIFDSSNNAYVSSCEGVITAANSCIAVDSTTAYSRGCWTTMNTGLPAPGAGHGTYQSIATFQFIGGVLYGAMADVSDNSVTNVGHWNGSTWILSAVPPTPGVVTQMDYDSNGNIYTGGSAGNLFKSSDGGDHWTSVATFGGQQTNGGAVFGLDVWGDVVYWGGESPLFKNPISNFSTYCRLLSGINGSPNGASDFNCTLLNTHQYAHNMRGSNSDGTRSIAPTKYLFGLQDDITAGGGSYLQRYDMVAGTWTRMPPAATPSPCTSTDTTGMFYFQMRKGTTPGEYYIPTGNVNNCTLLIGSLDYGATWAIVGDAKTTAGVANSGVKLAVLGISPVDDSKIVASNGAQSGNPLPSIYYHPGFPASTSGGTATSGQISLTGIIH